MSATAIPLPPEPASDRLSEAAARAERGKERLVLMRDGKPVAAVVPIEDLQALEMLEDEQDSRLGAEALAQWESEGRPAGVPLQEIARQLGIDPTADR